MSSAAAAACRGKTTCMHARAGAARGRAGGDSAEHPGERARGAPAAGARGAAGRPGRDAHAVSLDDPIVEAAGLSRAWTPCGRSSRVR